MGHGPAEHIEHAEHAAHAAHDRQNKVVTISIAIIAAVLAAVTIQGHELHNAVLSHQLLAGISHNGETNAWNEYQAYNIRSHAYRANLEFADTVAVAPGKDAKRAEALKRWQGQVEKYENANMPQAQKKVEQFK